LKLRSAPNVFVFTGVQQVFESLKNNLQETMQELIGLTATCIRLQVDSSGRLSSKAGEYCFGDLYAFLGPSFARKLSSAVYDTLTSYLLSQEAYEDQLSCVEMSSKNRITKININLATLQQRVFQKLNYLVDPAFLQHFTNHENKQACYHQCLVAYASRSQQHLTELCTDARAVVSNDPELLTILDKLCGGSGGGGGSGSSDSVEWSKLYLTLTTSSTSVTKAVATSAWSKMAGNKILLNGKQASGQLALDLPLMSVEDLVALVYMVRRQLLTKRKRAASVEATRPAKRK
jgi:hypothetical protein